MTAHADGDDSRLAELLLRWEDLHDQGRSVSPEELCSTCPELAEELGRRIAMLRQLDPLMDGTTTADGHGPRPEPTPASPRQSATARAEFHDLRFHAAGALGEVFMARNAELNRDVALKFLKPERLRDADSRRRFLQEAEVTGRLEHPGVVPIYALGTDAHGSPCYAMRFIRGETLQDAIDAFHAAEKAGRGLTERSLAFRDLLDRFVSICSTMAYSHSRGILHRDLKPRNVMLGKYDETLVVDWGLAKPFERDDLARSVGEETLTPISGTEDCSDTPTVGVVGTPAYMSPEQAEARWDLVGPASDVFGLGAILYAILTGQAPYQGRRIGEVLEKVRRCEFPPPRQVKPGGPPALEAICLKAMARKPEDRYGSALDLAADVRRWLADEPVVAYRESVVAQARRWMRRHRTLMAGAAAAVLAGLIGLGGVALVQSKSNRDLREANRKTSRALEAQKIANEKTSRARGGDQGQEGEGGGVGTIGGGAPARRGGAGLPQGRRASSHPARGAGRRPGPRGDGAEGRQRSRAQDREGIPGSAGRRGGCPQHAGTDLLLPGRLPTRHFAVPARLELQEAKLEPGHADTLSTRIDLAAAYAKAGRTAEAIRMHEETLRLSEAKLGPGHPKTLSSRNGLAAAYNEAGRTAEAIRMHEETLRLWEAKLGPDHPDTLTTRHNLAVAYWAAGRTAEAIRLHEETLRLHQAKLGPDHPSTLIVRHVLALAYAAAGRTAEAIRMHEETLRLKEAKLGPEHPSTLASRNGLAEAFEKAGRTAEAMRMFEETLRLCEAKLGQDHPGTLMSRNNLANAYWDAGRTADAIRMHEETLRLKEAKLGPDHPDTLLGRSNLARAYHLAGRTAEAIRMHEETLRLSEAKLGPGHPKTLTSRNYLATAYAEAGRVAEAMRMFEETLRLREAKLGPDHPDTLTSRNNLAAAYQMTGRTAEAIRLHEETLRLSQAKLGPDHPGTLSSRSNLANTYRDAGRTAEAIRLHEETLRLREAKLGPEHPDTLSSRNGLAVAYRDAGRVGEAIRLHQETLRLREAKLGPDHPDTLNTRSHLAESYEKVGRWSEAESLRRDMLAYRRRVEKPESPPFAGELASLGANLLKQANWSEAEPVLRECLVIRDKVMPDHWLRFNTMSLLGGALLGQGHYAKAEPLIVGGYEGLRARAARIPPQARIRLPEAAERLIRLYEAWGQPAKASAWKARLGLADLPDDVFAPP